MSVRTSTLSPTGETPYALVYGSEAVALAELALPTHRVVNFETDLNVTARLNDLDVLDERRIMARLHSKAYKDRTKRTHDKTIHCRLIYLGDWVLRKIEVTAQRMEADKLTPNREGPYRVHNKVRLGTYQLEKQDGTLLPNP